MKLVGIDLSTNPKNCGVCVLEGDAIAHVGRGDATGDHPDWLVKYCAGADVVAIDVPFDPPEQVTDDVLRIEGWIRVPKGKISRS